MQAKTVWKEKMQFQGSSGGHEVMLDTKSPVGSDTGLTPKELVAIGACGCTAMDVVGLMRKFKQNLTSLEVSADITTTEKVHPAVFTGLRFQFDAKGEVDPQKLLEAVSLSQTKYCGVSAMLADSFPIDYVVHLNGEEIGRGKAKFK